MALEINQEVTVMLRSIIGLVFISLATATSPAALAQTPPTIDEVAGHLRAHAETLPNETTRLDYLKSLLMMLPWEVPSEEIDRLYADIAQIAGRQAYDSFYWVGFHSRMANVQIERGNDKLARQILRDLEPLAKGKDRYFHWRQCEKSRRGCTRTPFAYLYRDIAYAYLKLGDKEDALRALENLVEVDLGPDGQEFYPDDFWRISRVIREYLKLGETQLAETLYDRVVAAYLEGDDADKYDQAQLIALAVRLEHHENPKATETFEKAIRHFQVAGSQYSNRPDVDGRTDLLSFLQDSEYQTKAGALARRIYKDLSESGNVPGWRATLEALLQYPSSPEIEKDLIDLYKRRLESQKPSDGRQTRTLWSPLSGTALSHNHLFDLQIRVDDLPGAEKTFSWLLHKEPDAVGYDETIDLAILNAEQGKRVRALDLQQKGGKAFATEPDPRSHSRYGYGDDELKSASALINIHLGRSLLATNRPQAEEHLLQAWTDIKSADSESLDLGLYRTLIRTIKCHADFNPEDITNPVSPARDCLPSR